MMPYTPRREVEMFAWGCSFSAMVSGRSAAQARLEEEEREKEKEENERERQRENIEAERRKRQQEEEEEERRWLERFSRSCSLRVPTNTSIQQHNGPELTSSSSSASSSSSRLDRLLLNPPAVGQGFPIPSHTPIIDTPPGSPIVKAVGGYGYLPSSAAHTIPTVPTGNAITPSAIGGFCDRVPTTPPASPDRTSVAPARAVEEVGDDVDVDEAIDVASASSSGPSVKQKTIIPDNTATGGIERGNRDGDVDMAAVITQAIAAASLVDQEPHNGGGGGSHHQLVTGVRRYHSNPQLGSSAAGSSSPSFVSSSYHMHASSSDHGYHTLTTTTTTTTTSVSTPSSNLSSENGNSSTSSRLTVVDLNPTTTTTEIPHFPHSSAFSHAYLPLPTSMMDSLNLGASRTALTRSEVLLGMGMMAAMARYRGNCHYSLGRAGRGPGQNVRYLVRGREREEDTGDGGGGGRGVKMYSGGYVWKGWGASSSSSLSPSSSSSGTGKGGGVDASGRIGKRMGGPLAGSSSSGKGKMVVGARGSGGVRKGGSVVGKVGSSSTGYGASYSAGGPSLSDVYMDQYCSESGIEHYLAGSSAGYGNVSNTGIQPQEDGDGDVEML